MHLTLYFFGAADEALERRIVESLAVPIGGPPFDLAFEGVGFFPERGSPRVLWLGVRLGGAELRRVQAELVARLPVPAEREAYSPHLTLARLRERVPLAQLTKTADIPSFAGPTRIDRVTLYESRLSPAGPEYVRIAEAPLQP
jgi:2'-5' RNA ligase